MNMRANLLRLVRFERTGVRFAGSQAELLQYVKNLLALDFHLSREIVDTNLAHPPLFNSVPPLCRYMLIAPLSITIRSFPWLGKVRRILRAFLFRCLRFRCACLNLCLHRVLSRLFNFCFLRLVHAFGFFKHISRVFLLRLLCLQIRNRRL